MLSTHEKARWGNMLLCLPTKPLNATLKQLIVFSEYEIFFLSTHSANFPCWAIVIFFLGEVEASGFVFIFVFLFLLCVSQNILNCYFLSFSLIIHLLFIRFLLKMPRRLVIILWLFPMKCFCSRSTAFFQSRPRKLAYGP